MKFLPKAAQSAGWNGTLIKKVQVLSTLD